MTSAARNGNSRAGGGGVTWRGGLKQKCPAWGGGEENGYFLELHIRCSRFLCPHFTLNIF